MAVLSFAYASMDSTLGLWSSRVLAWDARDVSLGFTLAGLAAVFALWVLIPRLCARYGESRVTAGASAAMALGLALFVACPGDYAIALALMLLGAGIAMRSEEHTSELQSLMRISYAVFCLKKKKRKHTKNKTENIHKNEQC